MGLRNWSFHSYILSQIIVIDCYVSMETCCLEMYIIWSFKLHKEFPTKCQSISREILNLSKHYNAHLRNIDNLADIWNSYYAIGQVKYWGLGVVMTWIDWVRFMGLKHIEVLVTELSWIQENVSVPVVLLFVTMSSKIRPFNGESPVQFSDDRSVIF